MVLLPCFAGSAHGMSHPLTWYRTLQVLNIAGNQLSGSIRVQGVPKLRALIANDNAITAVLGAQGCRQCLHGRCFPAEQISDIVLLSSNSQHSHSIDAPMPCSPFDMYL